MSENNNTFKKAIDLIKKMEDTTHYYSVTKNFSNPKYHNPEMCAKCKGLCCHSSGCLISPDDFNLKVSFLAEAVNYRIAYTIIREELEKGYITIEAIDGDQVYINNGIILILHVRDARAPICVSLRKRKHSHCILLTDKGCPFSFSDRPTGGKMLIPNFPQCTNDYSLYDCCKEWLPFQHVLKDLFEDYKDKDIKCSI